MKIITPGQIQNKVMHGKCLNCKCVIEALESEWIHAGTIPNFKYLKCPTENCSGEIMMLRGPARKPKYIERDA